MSRISAKLEKLLLARDGHRSAWTGRDVETLVPHHIKNRGMGGAKSLDRIEWLVWLESDINLAVEADEHWALEASRRGLKQSRNSKEVKPVQHAVHGLVWLLPNGSVEEVGKDVEF